MCLLATLTCFAQFQLLRESQLGIHSWDPVCSSLLIYFPTASRLRSWTCPESFLRLSWCAGTVSCGDGWRVGASVQRPGSHCQGLPQRGAFETSARGLGSGHHPAVGQRAETIITPLSFAPISQNPVSASGENQTGKEKDALNNLSLILY